MQDSYGRLIDYLRLSITDRCNLRCRYCMPEEGVPPLRHEDVLSYEELLRIARVAVRLGVRKIRITGGEPLVRRGVVDFIQQLTRLPEAPEVALTTNGLLLAELAGALRAAGLSGVNVSLDTLRRDRFLQITRRDELERVLAGLTAAETAGLQPLKLNMVPIAGVNDDEIVDFAHLALERCWEVRFIEYMPVSSGLDFPPESRVPAERIMAELARVGTLVPLPRPQSGGPARLFRYADGVGQLGLIPAVSQHFCGECNRLRITADGRVRPCLFSNAEVDLRQGLRSGHSDEQLAASLLLAVADKPEGHCIGSDAFIPVDRRMQGIGG